jgi:hypothetical protein
MKNLKELLLSNSDIILTPKELKSIMKKMISTGFQLSNSGDNGECTNDTDTFQIYNDQYNEMFEPNRIELNRIINNKIRQINEFHKNNIHIKIPNDLKFLNLVDNKLYMYIREFELELYSFIEELEYNKVTEYLNILNKN